MLYLTTCCLLPSIRHWLQQVLAVHSHSLKPCPNSLGVSLGRHPLGFYPGDSHQTMTSISVWDTGRPNGDQCHPLVPVGSVVRGTAATCLTMAVACPHYGPNSTTSLSMQIGNAQVVGMDTLACKSSLIFPARQSLTINALLFGITLSSFFFKPRPRTYDLLMTLVSCIQLAQTQEHALMMLAHTLVCMCTHCVNGPVQNLITPVSSIEQLIAYSCAQHIHSTHTHTYTYTHTHTHTLHSQIYMSQKQ